jgi:hypothetical protein
MTITAEPCAPSTPDLAGRAAWVGGRTLTDITDVRGDKLITACSPGQERPADTVVALPQLGELVAATSLTGQPVHGYWLGTLSRDLQNERLEALILDGATTSTVRFAPGQVESRRVVIGHANDGARAAMTALLAEAQAHQTTRAEHTRRIDRLVEAAHEEANDRDWCSSFDDFMESQGLPRRERDYDLRVEVTAIVYLTRSGANIDEAIGSLDTDDLRDELRHVDLEWEAGED